MEQDQIGEDSCSALNGTEVARLGSARSRGLSGGSQREITASPENGKDRIWLIDPHRHLENKSGVIN